MLGSCWVDCDIASCGIGMVDQDLMDIFAAAALQGLLSGDGSAGYQLGYLAEGAYQIAVEMMKARAKIIGGLDERAPG